MYKHGHELPEFAMFPLLGDRRAVADLKDMYTGYLEVAAKHGFVALMRAMTFGSVAEGIGIARAAADAGCRSRSRSWSTPPAGCSTGRH